LKEIKYEIQKVKEFLDIRFQEEKEIRKSQDSIRDKITELESDLKDEEKKSATILKNLGFITENHCQHLMSALGDLSETLNSLKFDLSRSYEYYPDLETELYGK